jgi:hypothetical protein
LDDNEFIAAILLHGGILGQLLIFQERLIGQLIY